MVVRLFAVLFVLLCALPAQAGTIAVIDFQRAVVETDEGKSAQTRIDTMYESRRGEIERMRSELEREAQEFQSQAMILADSARAEREQALIAKNQRFQQTAMQYETELARGDWRQGRHRLQMIVNWSAEGKHYKGGDENLNVRLSQARVEISNLAGQLLDTLAVYDTRNKTAEWIADLKAGKSWFDL